MFLSGITDLFTSLLETFPIAQANELLTSAPAMIEQSITPILFWVSPIINLRLIGIAIGLILALETVRAAIAIWRWILSIIPAAS